MNALKIKKIIQECLTDGQSVDQAVDEILGILQTKEAQIDLDREDRCGLQEVI